MYFQDTTWASSSQPMILNNSETPWVIERSLSGQVLSERPSLHLCSGDCRWWGWGRQRQHCRKGPASCPSLDHTRTQASCTWSWLAHRTWWPRWCGKHTWRRTWVFPGVSGCLRWRQKCGHKRPGWRKVVSKARWNPRWSPTGHWGRCLHKPTSGQQGPHRRSGLSCGGHNKADAWWRQYRSGPQLD